MHNKYRNVKKLLKNIYVIERSRYCYGPYLGFRLELASKVLGLVPNDSSTGNYN